MFRVYRSNHETYSISRASLQQEGVYDNPSLTYERGNGDRSGEYEFPLSTLITTTIEVNNDSVYEIIQEGGSTQTENMIELLPGSLLNAL